MIDVQAGGRTSRLLRFWLLCVVLWMLGCSGGGEGKRPIVLWHAYRGDELKALEASIGTFKGGEVELLALPYDAFAAKLQAAIPLGEGPDLFIDQHERLGDYKGRHLVAPVGDALADPKLISPPALKAVTLGGEVLAVPLSQKCVALYVNTDLATTPDSLEAIAKLKDSLPKGTFPLVYEASNAYAHAGLLAAFGGELLTADDAYGFIGEPARASIEMARSLVQRGVVPEDADGALVTNLFKGGQAAFAVSGPWLAADLASAKSLHYKVVPLPKVEATGQPMRPLLTVESVMLSPRGAQRPEARALARHLGSLEAALERQRTAKALSARNDVAIPADAPLLAAFAEQARAAIPMPSSRAMRAVWEPANRALRKALRGDATAEAALQEGKERFDDVRLPLPPARSPVTLLLFLGFGALFLAFRWWRAAEKEGWRKQLKRSLPAYAYLTHAVIALSVLVFLPLTIGAATSLFAGADEARRYVGLANFVSILTARGKPLLSSGSFYLVLGVTVLWTAVNLALHVGIGLVLALLLSRPTLRFRAAYRVLLIIPWAVPSYVTALAWKGMFHRQFGAVTALILAANKVFHTNVEPIAWFSKFSTAFTANVATNVWLGFPFMMVVTLGALTGVPNDVLEAAKVDGATRWQRLWLVTLPMIRPTLAPAVTLGAVWTFNMFNVVFLVSGGDPDGTTDILVSEAYRWAFTREAQYGYAAAYAVLIFVILFGATKLRARVMEPA